MTRLHLTTATQRLVVGYDTELATYYVETGPVTSASERAEDPDEGLVTVRGRIRGDLPRLPDVLAELDRHRITLTPRQQYQLDVGPQARSSSPVRGP